MPIVLDTLSNAEYSLTSNIKKKQYTIHYRSTLMNIRLCTNVICRNALPRFRCSADGEARSHVTYLPMTSASQPPRNEPIMPPGMKRAVVSAQVNWTAVSDTDP